MIHADYDVAFSRAAGNGHIDTLQYLVSLEKDPEARSKMIHANNDDSFRSAGADRDIETIKYLVSIEEDPVKRSKMIHAGDDHVFCWVPGQANDFEIIQYLLSLEKDPEARSKMIHAQEDYAFIRTAESYRKDLLKLLVVSDPFYEWHEDYDLTNLNYYKKIDIKTLCKISTLCKNLFSNSIHAAKNNQNNISFVDLPTEILDKILQNLAQVDNEPYNCIRIESVVKAFTYDSSNYFDGFKGFTYRYESALKELGAIKDGTEESE